MSAGGSGAMQRMAADQEAARARESAEAAPEPQRAPLKARVETPEPTAAGPNDAALEGTPAPTSDTPHLIDVQA
jgi:hypothetical protein